MSNIYDRIFKEDIEPILEVFAAEVLHINLAKTEELKDKIQATWEREGDYLKKLTYDDPAKNCVLHIEFHVKDEDLSKWMLLTYGMIYHQFGLPVRQFVVYVGRRKRPRMHSETKHENCHHRFTIVNLREFSHKMFLNSDIPELVVLAILADFEGEPSEKIIRDILGKLHRLRGDEANLGKYVQQLEILSKLRNLQPLTSKIIAAMPFVYDLETDIRFKQGRKKGREEGRGEGLEEAKTEFVEKLLLEGKFSTQQIMNLAGVTEAFIEKVKSGIAAGSQPPKSNKKGKKP